MIARLRRGWMNARDAGAFIRRLDDDLIVETTRAPGNRGALILSRRAGDCVELLLLSLWSTRELGRQFAERSANVEIWSGVDDLNEEHEYEFLVRGDLALSAAVLFSSEHG